MATQYIQVPVPSHLVPAVMTLISDSFALSSESKASMSWSEAELRKIWQESAKNMRQTLLLLAKHQGEAISGQTIASVALGKDKKGYSVAGMMGAYHRRMKGRHKGRSPIVSVFDAGANEWRYSMDPEVGRAFQKLSLQQ